MLLPCRKMLDKLSLSAQWWQLAEAGVLRCHCPSLQGQDRQAGEGGRGAGIWESVG